MLRFLQIIVLLCLYFYSFSQDDEIARIIPPSPEATQMVLYGNNNVNYYTGAVDISIPIYTINEKGYQLPISLNYNGSNGIRVTETASWVGLGWNLTAGGVVSRTIRGVADDDKLKGGILYKPLPCPIIEEDNENYFLNVNEFQNILNGIRDGEPDQFHYNIPGYSGTFYLKKKEDQVIVVQKPLTNCVIEPNINDAKQRFSLESFKIITPDGIVYSFTEKENTRSYSFGTGSQLFDLDYRTTSWYLTHITNYNKTFNIELEYHTLYEISLTEELASNEIWMGENYQEYYQTYLTQNPKRIKQIKFSNGFISFEKSDISRIDVKHDTWLKNIRIYSGYPEISEKLIDEFTMEYDYFTANGHTDINTSIESQNNSYRLCLKSIQRQNEVPHKFVYNSNVYLPARDSKARDHWGYYNGKHTNQTLEPKYKVLYISGHSHDEPIIQRRIIGEADRFPDPLYSQAGMLTEVHYPTGGYTKFVYENHQVSDDSISIRKPLRKLNKFIKNDEENKNVSIPLPQREIGSYDQILVSNFYYADIELVDQPFAELRARLLGRFIDNVEYWLILKEIGQNDEKSFCIWDGKSIIDNTIFIEEGNYECYLKLIDPNMYVEYENTDNMPLIVNISWENELFTPIRTVGGLRIKRILNNDGNNIYTKEFSYLESNNTSSGKIGIVPKYGFEAEQKTNNGSFANPNLYAFSTYVRTVNTNKPLVFTKGSPIGYSRIEVKLLNEQNESNGKQVYEYSTFNEFDDIHCYYTEYPINLGFAYDKTESGIIDALNIPFNSKDNLRGNLISEKVFTKENKLIKSVKYYYKKLHYTPESVIPQKVMEDEYVLGLVCRSVCKNSITGPIPSGDPSYITYVSPDDIGIFGYYKDFGVWNGNYITETITQDVKTKSINYYDQIGLDIEDKYYQVTSNQLIINSQDVKTVKYKYNYDDIGLNEENEYASKQLLLKNVIVPIETHEFYNNDTLDIIRIHQS